MLPMTTSGVASATSDSVIVAANQVTFDARGRATIRNGEANAFIARSLNESGAITITEPGLRRTADTNIALCGKNNNLYCPNTNVPQPTSS